MILIVNNIILTVIFNLCCTYFLTLIDNKSNFRTSLIVPIISSLITKYTLGDWDVGYQWTVSDIFYWLILLSTSYVFVIFKNNLS